MMRFYVWVEREEQDCGWKAWVLLGVDGRGVGKALILLGVGEGLGAIGCGESLGVTGCWGRSRYCWVLWKICVCCVRV